MLLALCFFPFCTIVQALFLGWQQATKTGAQDENIAKVGEIFVYQFF